MSYCDCIGMAGRIVPSHPPNPMQYPFSDRAKPVIKTLSPSSRNVLFLALLLMINSSRPIFDFSIKLP